MKVRIPLLCAAAMSIMAGGLAAQAKPATGKDLYDANCKKCHGAIGTPPKAMKTQFPKIATFDAAFIAKHTVDSMVTILTKGKGEDMKPFKGTMSAADMKAVATYVKELASKPR